MKSINLSISIFIALTISVGSGYSQKKLTTNFHKVEPPFWFTGMRNSDLQILFYNKDISLNEFSPSILYDGVILKGVDRTENPHYLFLNLEIGSRAKAGIISITFQFGKRKINYSYELKSKSTDKNRIQGFSSADVIYLIMPDRFANGDIKNDTVEGFYQGTHREKPFGRHGGDLKGIGDHLDYFKNLGVTALWLNPVLENNQKRESYHGYAVTDLYQVDKRFGSNQDYLDLINESHKNGLKVIQDMVMNHIGNEHWLVKDLPSKDWIHQFPTYTSSNYRGVIISDPYHSQADEDIMSKGWFDTTMPDINQQNPLFAKYLIQNSIWWIEYGGLDGIRMDTYPYPDKKFMADWCKELLAEYPQFNIVGEAWLPTVAGTAYWQKGSKNADGYESTLPSVTDFPLSFTIPKAFNEEGGWDTGLVRLFEMLGQDGAYPNANNNLIFLDNHDVTRFYRSIGSDLNKFKMAVTFLLTTRGIPQLYYGTELLMDGDASSHPEVRKDFPGGWANDKINAFTKDGLTKDQLEATEFMTKLLNWRKDKSVIHSGKMTHFLPKDNVYVYFKTNGNEKVMVIINGSDKPQKINPVSFQEILRGKLKAKNALTSEVIGDLTQFALAPKSCFIFEILE